MARNFFLQLPLSQNHRFLVAQTVSSCYRSRARCWWSERRKVAGELLDLGEPRLAFELCDNMVRPDDPANQVDANFFAGWIALRFLNDARAAALR